MTKIQEIIVPYNGKDYRVAYSNSGVKAVMEMDGTHVRPPRKWLWVVEALPMDMPERNFLILTVKNILERDSFLLAMI